MNSPFEHILSAAPTTEHSKLNPQSERSSPAAADNPQCQSPHSDPNTPPAAGRPRKLNEISCREVCALISAGCGIEEAARYVGCAPSTIRREAARNAPFNEDLRRAYLSAELAPLNAMRRAASTHWRAAAWLLERTNPQRFARQNLKLLKPEQVRQFLDKLLEVYVDECRDPETRERIIARFARINEEIDREAEAARQPLVPPHDPSNHRWPTDVPNQVPDPPPSQSD